MRVRAVAVAAERNAVAAREALAARATTMARAKSQKARDDDDGSVSGSTVGYRRHSASSTASTSDSDADSINQSIAKDESEEKNARKELLQVHREHMHQQEDHDHTQLQLQAAGTVECGTSEPGLSTPCQLDMHDDSTEWELQTIEAVQPGLHCYLPLGEDFGSD